MLKYLDLANLYNKKKTSIESFCTHLYFTRKFIYFEKSDFNENMDVYVGIKNFVE